MSSKDPRDINGDGQVDKRERMISNLGMEAAAGSKDSPDRPPFVNSKTSTSGRKPVTGDNCINDAGVSKRYLDMFEHDPEEVIVAEIKKHPIGLVAIWTVTALVIIGVWILAGLLGHYQDSVTANIAIKGSDFTTAVYGLAGFATLFALLFGYISAFLYVNNRIIVTSEKMVQIRYFSLFNRKVSSLSMGDVQDVTARQSGLLQTIFGFGKISIETAGEQDNYEFPTAVKADENAKIIVQCHEENLHKYGN